MARESDDPPPRLPAGGVAATGAGPDGDDAGEPPIRLLYIRDPRQDCSALDHRLARIAARYAPMVDLQAVAPWELPAPLAAAAGPIPRVLILRRGQPIGGATGALLPARELDQVVRCAIEWTDRPADLDG